MEPVVEVPEAPALAVSEQADLLGPEVPLQEAIPAIAASGEEATTDFIEVWRPGRRDDNKSSQRASRRRRTHPSSTARTVAAHLPSTAELGAAAEQAEQSTSPDLGAAAEQAEQSTSPDLGAAAEQAEQSTSPDPAPPNRRDQPPRGPRRRRRHEREKEAGEQTGPDRADRRRHDMTPARRAGRPQASQRADRPDRPARADRPDRDPALRAKYIKTRAEAGALREPDPDSPFAKLAQLKEQLEANAKEPR
jgi:ATP-dependent RNA helicase SUPV3L1/SUV3